MKNAMDPALQKILDAMHILAAEGKVGGAIVLERKLLLYIQHRCIQAYNLGVARNESRVPIPQWLADMGVAP